MLFQLILIKGKKQQNGQKRITSSEQGEEGVVEMTSLDCYIEQKVLRMQLKLWTQGEKDREGKKTWKQTESCYSYMVIMKA